MSNDDDFKRRAAGDLTIDEMLEVLDGFAEPLAHYFLRPEDAKGIAARLRSLEKVVTEARTMRRYCLGSDASTENMLRRFDSALKELDGEK